MRVQDSGFRICVLRSEVYFFLFRVQGLWLWVWGVGFRVKDCGFRDESLVFRFKDGRLRVWGLGLRIWRLEVKVEG